MFSNHSNKLSEAVEAQKLINDLVDARNMLNSAILGALVTVATPEQKKIIKEVIELVDSDNKDLFHNKTNCKQLIDTYLSFCNFHVIDSPHTPSTYSGDSSGAHSSYDGGDGGCGDSGCGGGDG